MNLRNIKLTANTSTVLTMLVLMVISFLISPSNATQEKDVMTLFIEQKLSANLNKTRLMEVQKVAKTITDGSKMTKLDPLMILAIMEHESQYQTHAVGMHGEIGLLQVRPETAEWIMKRHDKIWTGKKMLYDPKNNVQIGILYLSLLHKQFKTPQKTLAAYNMGPAATQKYLKKNIVPKVYYKKVFSKYQGLLMEYDTYLLSLNPKAKPPRLTASK